MFVQLALTFVKALRKAMVRFLKPDTTDPPLPPASEVSVPADTNTAATPASAPALPSAPASGSKGRAKEPPFQFITIPGNVNEVEEVRTDLLAPATQAKADSDQEGEDDHSANTSRDIMAKRNTKFAHKH